MTEMSNMPSMKSCKLTSLEIASLDMPPENAATTITVDINVFIEETKNNPLLKPVKLRVNLSSDNNTFYRLSAEVSASFLFSNHEDDAAMNAYIEQIGVKEMFSFLRTAIDSITALFDNGAINMPDLYTFMDRTTD